MSAKGAPRRWRRLVRRFIIASHVLVEESDAAFCEIGLRQCSQGGTDRKNHPATMARDTDRFGGGELFLMPLTRPTNSTNVSPNRRQ